MTMMSIAAVKKHKQQLQQNTLVGASLAPSAARLLSYSSNMASLKSKMAGDDVIKSHGPGCVSDNAMYVNGNMTATIDRQKVRVFCYATQLAIFIVVLTF